MKLFLFDLDGTLVSTGGAGLRALDQTFQDLHGVKDVLNVVEPSGKTDPAIFREIVQKTLNRDMTPADFSAISSHYLSQLKDEIQHRSNVVTLKGVKNFLNFLSTQEDVIVALGTGNLEDGARLKLGPTGLNDYFEFGGFGSDAEVRSDMLKVGHQRAEEKTNAKIDPENVFVLGDTVLDVGAAHRAGYRSVAIASGKYSVSQLQESEPHFVLSSMEEGENFLNQTRGAHVER